LHIHRMQPLRKNSWKMVLLKRRKLRKK
jgi:hypothetical protein